MTTTVKITAHVSPDKEVEVLVSGERDRILQDGESCELYAYDAREITVREILKVKE